MHSCLVTHRQVVLHTWSVSLSSLSWCRSKVFCVTAGSGWETAWDAPVSKFSILRIQASACRRGFRIGCCAPKQLLCSFSLSPDS